MAIAGVKPVSYLEIGEDNKTEIYTRNQVREILIKFAKSVSVSRDIEYNWEDGPTLVGFSIMMGRLEIDDSEDIKDAVDEFMKKGD